jgi:hypothetical protein
MNNRVCRISVSAVLVAVSCFALPAYAAPRVQYRLRLQKGQKYYAKMVAEQKIAQTVMGQSQDIEQSIGLGSDLDVVDVDRSGNAEIRHTYRWAKLRVQGPMQQVVYDSSVKGGSVPGPAQGLAALVGESYSLSIAPDGRVLIVKGAARMRANVRKKLPAGFAGDLQMSSLAQYIDDQGIKEAAEASMAVLPNKPVGVGDSWSGQIVLSESTALIMQNKWTLKQRQAGTATINVVSTIKPNPQAPPRDVGTAKISSQFSGKQQGLIRLDEATGLIVHSKLEQQLSGEAKVVGPQQMSIPMKIDSVVTTEITRRKK